MRTKLEKALWNPAAFKDRSGSKSKSTADQRRAKRNAQRRARARNRR